MVSMVFNEFDETLSAIETLTSICNHPLIVYKIVRKEIEAHSYLAPLVYHCEAELKELSSSGCFINNQLVKSLGKNQTLGIHVSAKIMPRKSEHRALRHGQGTKGCGVEMRFSQMR